MNRKGQIATYDLLFAVIVFMAIFLLMNNIWAENYANALKKEETRRMQFSARQAIKVLTGSAGYPEEWTSEDVEVPGLLEEHGSKRLSNEKIEELDGMDYNAVKDLLKIGEYDFMISVNALNDLYDKEIGLPVSGESKAVRLERVVYYKGGNANVSLTLFK